MGQNEKTRVDSGNNQLGNRINMKNKYELIVTFNEYTGNFHREFNAFVLAVGCDHTSEDADTMLPAGTTAFLKINQDPDDVLDDLMEFYHHFYDEYGSNVSELTQVKNTKGKYECNGITVFFDKDPAEIMPIILKQLAAFPAAVAKASSFAPKKLKVLKVEFAKETITREVKEIKVLSE